MIRVGSDFSGVGAFNQALIRLGIDYDEVFACDMDKYARQTFIHNYGQPKYYPENVYDREIPKESLDIYMTSPPCQAFSLAGKRLGKADKRGVLFFNSHEFIQVNKPRFFIFENVKGLLSDDNGKTFSEWLNYLGGKSVNGNPVLFPVDEAVPYHIYWKVLNAKDYNVPQNRERVFIVGIRDDADNNFSWPKEETLTKRLKDVLEDDVPDKYFLSEKMMELLTFQNKTNGEVANLNKGGERGSVYSENSNEMSCLSATDYKQPKQILVGTWRTHKDGQGFREIEDNNCQTIPARAREDGSGQPVIMIPSATQKGFELATENDPINFSVPNSKTRRGRVVKEVAQTLDTACNQGIIQLNNPKHSQQRIYSTNGISPTISAGNDGGGQNPVKHLTNDYRIRRLTPRECFRLMDFPDIFTWPVSDSQAYKQAGNSIVVKMLELIISRLNILPPVQP
jgi:DNA (cytosine-5)-methyltransferase 1